MDGSRLETQAELRTGGVVWRRAWKMATGGWMVYVWLAAVLAAGAALRLVGIDWDAGQHLHPDERFLTMVETALRWPSSLAEYFDTVRNPLSPYNNGYNFFVYGTLPLYLVKWLGNTLGRAGYDEVHLVGRAASAVFDLGSVAVLFFIGRRLYGAGVGLLGAALLSLSVLNIQQSHFFTVDTFANFFVVLTVYFAVRASANGHWWEFALVGLALGAGVASKISVYTLGVVVTAAAALHLHAAYRTRRAGFEPLLEQAVVRLVLAAALSLVVFRVLQPISFQGSSVLSFVPNERWLANMQEVRELMDGTRDTPPGHQWTDRPALWFPWVNMVLWGLGLPLGLAAWAGWGIALYELVRHRKYAHLLPVLYVGLVFFNQGSQFVKSMRYLLPVYPFLALFAAYLIARVWRWAREEAGAGWWTLPGLVRPRALAATLAAVVVAGTAVWALAFTSIYTRPHSRVAASEWMFASIPKGATIANEHWDDALPLRVGGRDAFGGWYTGIDLPHYHEEGPEKVTQIVSGLDRADYVVLSSNRLYDSIPRLPTRFPMSTRYYKLLFSGELGFEKVAEFTSYPSLLGFSIPDQSAEEAFTVYDHPKVTIFRKVETYDTARVRHLLTQGIDWTQLVRMRADQASKTPNALLLTPEERMVYESAGTWSMLYDPSSLANQYPIAFWVLALLSLGLLAAPLTFAALGGLSDRGLIFARPLGLLLVGWVVWLLGSAKLMPFGLPAIAVALASLGLASLLAILPRRAAFQSFLGKRWRLLLVQEALFWGLFAAFVLVRYANPDLWHPYMGGEKPMDFAYLNAVLKSAYFPPYDPWFAGGYINYYYFGFVLVAVLVKLTGIIPEVAYNLAVPTLFAFTGAGAFAVAYSLADGWRWRVGVGDAGPGAGRLGPALAGTFGTLFVAVLGNLHELRMINDGLRALSKVTFPSYIPGLVGLVQAADGARQVLFEGRSLGFRNEWWYWNATRLIDHLPNEAGPITEFPFFTFLYGDLHAHAMALPYTVLALGLATSILLSAERAALGSGDGGAGRRGVLGAAWYRIEQSGIFTLLVPGLVVGALWPLNTWDFPTYLVIVGAAIALGEYARRGAVNSGTLWAVGYRWVALVAVAYFAFLPFHRTYAAAYGSVELWRGTRTPLDDYLDAHGLFLFFIASYLSLELWRGHGLNSVARTIQLGLRRWRRPRRVFALNRLLVRGNGWHRAGLDLVVVAFFLVLSLLVLRQFVFALVLALLVLAGLLLLGERPAPRRQFALCLVGLGLALTLAVEVVVLKGDISRMNTVFKFYLQVWTMWAVFSAAAFAWLLALPSAPRSAATSESTVHGEAAPATGRSSHPPDVDVAPSRATAAVSDRPQARKNGIWGDLWLATAVALVAACALYPWLATDARIKDRFDPAVGPTLDGAAYMRLAVYEDEGRRMTLAADREGIDWLRQNVQGSPTIVEGVTPLYRWGSRVSVYTGLPTVIGWDWHQRQQRAVLPGEIIDRRLVDVRAIFSESDPVVAANLLRRYGVHYVYIGPVERVYYPQEGLAKFERHNGRFWERVFLGEQVAIYQVIE